MVLSITRFAVAIAILLGLVYAVSIVDTRQWRGRLQRRFVYGVPWGTALTVALIVAFYLFAQHGLWNWSEPVALPYVSWSYFYPTGLLTAGFAHGSPAHLVSNVTATIVFGVVAEYHWSHYPRGDGSPASSAGGAPPAASNRDGADSTPISGGTGWRSQPWFRAVVTFPAVLFAIAFLTAFFSLGPGLGFSGAVYAIVGFVLLVAPRLAIGGVVATAALGVFYDAITQPLIREGIETGAPSPPAWAGVGFHAHLLGFLVGVLCAIALLRARDRRPPVGEVFAALVLVGIVQSLWLLVWPAGSDEFVLYRGIGVAFVIVLTIVITIAVAGTDRPLPRPLSILPYTPTRRRLAVAWLVFLTLATLVLVVGGLAVAGAGFVVAILIVAYLLLVLPALPPVLPDRVTGGALGRRQAALATLVVLTTLVALVGVPFGLTVVGDEVPGSGGVEVGDYTVTYEANATADRSTLGFPDAETERTYDGLLVVSDDRELFTVGERAEVIEFDGEATVTVGGPGWHETVRAERLGWEVLGNETAYAVDLIHDGETTRSFTSEPVSVDATIDDHRLSIEPVDDAFVIHLERDGAAVGTVPIPDAGTTEQLDEFEFTTESADDGTLKLYATVDESTVKIAKQESY